VTVDALRLSLRHGQPESFKTDQGVRFTAHELTGELKKAEIRISMDGRCRGFDDILVVRL
jgi:putative transposase